MTSPTSTVGTSLARVTIGTPKRWMDVALPEHVPVAELLPYILRHAGEDAADTGEAHGGWLLRRPTGEALSSNQTLGGQKILDGEILQLVPGRLEWPELEYDDVVESIASGARRYGRSWGRTATRRCGLAACGVLLLVGTLVTLSFEPPWLVPGLVLLGAAVVLMALGVVISRAVPDARAGAVFGGAALPYAFLGGYLIAGPSYADVLNFGAPQLLLAAVSALVFGIVGYVGIAALSRLFAAAIAVGLLGMIGAAFGTFLEADAAAAVTLTFGIGLLPGYPLLAIRLGRIPLPALPQRSSELLEDHTPPKPATVYAAAARTDELLSGLLTGLAIVSVVAAWPLAMHGGATRLFLLLAAAVALLLRARLFAVLRQRLPLLISGTLVAIFLILVLITGADNNAIRALFLLGVGGIATLISFAGLTYSKKNPSPYLGRFADVFDVLAIVALVPLACYMAGFYTYVQGLLAGIG
ncbi:type VII secretion integral membrane protein EccD [Tamaricihabitans halophyticus]|uniref:Type VII secretion integral membrane protein EccD n=1 Tax=Tamaricihabitans halophyticus TaxID=1262583 RepID=A0A4R2QUE1_9PSEU|nr:type VII secretion integral membrane protein EccD [Tamaricihabitans halophyticus]TCP53593.1 type VII secretion integral membrane protein EccD [Tamaricihabitans halophyticus]